MALQIRRLASEELGVSLEDPPNSLTRDYVERKSPLGDHRTLAMAATMGLLGWAGGLLSTWKTCCVYVGVPSWVNKLGMSDMEQVVSSASAAKNVSCLVNT